MKRNSEKSKKVIVNLGCGPTRWPGSIGVDFVKIKGFVDIVHDLDKTPYPFKSNSVDEIHMYHVLEHLHNPLKKMEEIHRILKPGGVIHLRVPHFSSMGAFSDITHIRPFGYISMDPFIKGDGHEFYTKKRFEMVSREIRYFGLYPNSGNYAKYIHSSKYSLPVKAVVRIINFFIKLSPTFFERIWCYWVGGATEIYFILRKE